MLPSTSDELLSHAGFIPARNPAFSGRDAELEILRSAIVEKPGVAVIRGNPGSGKTALACEFANRFAKEFDGVIWLYSGERPPMELAGEIGLQMRHRMDGDTENNLYELATIFEWKRYLLVLDHVLRKSKLVTAGKSSTLITTRMPRLMPGAPGAKLDAPKHLEKFSGEIVSAMAACSPAGFPLSLAGELAGQEIDGIPAPAQVLNIDSFRCALPQFVIDQALIPDELRTRHAEAASRQPVTAGMIPDLYHALRWTLSRPESWELACELARHIISFTQFEGRIAEAFEVMETISAAAEIKEDYRTLNRYARERVWMLQAWGRDMEAKSLERRSRRWQAVQLPLPWDEGWT
ncbi:MAG TPA: NB-ARC domain-containing protein [Novimethylophilus sp.]|uniref:NB-ARC domain-containing protein n=1 Tax=Novimethylophilus sp. TaxID=2137426 RepID=UPI002F3E484A